jgi:hypothetical protein
VNYDQFIETGYRRYELFAGTIAAILQAAVDTHPQDFRLQQIKFRAKDPTSLRRKLTERGLLESETIEQELKDLAGCRLIFYTNTDVDRFLASRLIFDSLSISMAQKFTMPLANSALQTSCILRYTTWFRSKKIGWLFRNIPNVGECGAKYRFKRF